MGFSDYFKGIQSYGRAIQLIGEMRLWKYVLLPGLMALVIAALLGSSAWGLSDNLGQWILSWYPFEWGSEWMGSVSNWIGGILLGILGLILFKYIVMIVVSPFMSPLSQKVEERLTGRHTNNKGFQMAEAMSDIFRGLRVTLRNLIRELFFVAILLLLSFIPVVGIVATIAAFLIQAYYAGFGNMDYTLERRFTVRGSVRFVRDNKWLAMGNGTVFLLLLMTGVGFLVAPPLATVAATLETVKRLEPAPVSTPGDLV
ncbi:MAG: EI24 domain-containing protein [Bacteroidota bacterium]